MEIVLYRISTVPAKFSLSFSLPLSFSLSLSVTLSFYLYIFLFLSRLRIFGRLTAGSLRTQIMVSHVEAVDPPLCGPQSQTPRCVALRAREPGPDQGGPQSQGAQSAQGPDQD